MYFSCVDIFSMIKSSYPLKIRIFYDDCRIPIIKGEFGASLMRRILYENPKLSARAIKGICIGEYESFGSRSMSIDIVLYISITVHSPEHSQRITGAEFEALVAESSFRIFDPNKDRAIDTILVDEDHGYICIIDDVSREYGKAIEAVPKLKAKAEYAAAMEKLLKEELKIQRKRYTIAKANILQRINAIRYGNSYFASKLLDHDGPASPINFDFDELTERQYTALKNLIEKETSSIYSQSEEDYWKEQEKLDDEFWEEFAKTT